MKLFENRCTGKTQRTREAVVKAARENPDKHYCFLVHSGHSVKAGFLKILEMLHQDEILFCVNMDYLIYLKNGSKIQVNRFQGNRLRGAQLIYFVDHYVYEMCLRNMVRRYDFLSVEGLEQFIEEESNGNEMV